MKVKFTQILNAREERLPKKTGLGGKMPKMSPGPLFNPRITISTNSALKNALAYANPADAKQIRAKTVETLNSAVHTINKHLASSKTYKGIKFSVDEASGKNVVAVRDTRTGEVMKTMPGESAMKIAGNLRLLAGMIMDKQG